MQTLIMTEFYRSWPTEAFPLTEKIMILKNNFLLQRIDVIRPILEISNVLIYFVGSRFRINISPDYRDYSLFIFF
jgi:hypothetical protein